MNDDEIQDVESTVPPSSPIKSSVSGLDHVTTSTDGSCSPVLSTVDDKIPLVQLPPMKTEFTSFSELSEFLKSGPTIFSAFTKLYGKCRHNVASLMVTENAESLRSALHGFDTTVDVREAIYKDILQFSGHDLYFATSDQLKHMNAGGAFILLNCYRIAHSQLSMDGSSMNEWGEEWVTQVSELRHPIDDAEQFNKHMEEYVEDYHDRHQKAFDLDYIDVSQSVDNYCSILHNNMDQYLKCPEDYMGPYTSILTSSMMGKSRLMKQISLKIPSIYISLRTLNDGYPDKSPQDVIQYVLQTPLKTELEATNHFLSFFVALFNHLETFFNCRNGTPAQTREDLWMTLAQGEKGRLEHIHYIDQEKFSRLDPRSGPSIESITKVSAFWNAVVTNAETYRRRSDEDRLNLWGLLRQAWIRLQPKLSMQAESPPLLLIMWDEAKSLVTSGMDASRQFDHNKDDTISRFRLLRRALAEIGQLDVSERRVRMFTLFTDTSSHIADFQPSTARESKSFRHIAIQSRGTARFDPIYLIPTMNYAACAFLDLSLDDVDQPRRLIMFGRTAWSATARASLDSVDHDDYMKLTKTLITPVFDLAKAKLFRKAGLLQSLFDPSNKKNVLSEMVACLGPRLQLHSGSNVAAASDLVASHLMVLVRVDECHTDLEAVYPSEPILAAASAHATGQYGWRAPLEKLGYLISHGIVDKGYRGELITRILFLIASEDSLRQDIDPDKWAYTSQTQVSRLLNHLFRKPKADNTSFESEILTSTSTSSTVPVTSKRTRRKSRAVPDSTLSGPTSLDAEIPMPSTSITSVVPPASRDKKRKPQAVPRSASSPGPLSKKRRIQKFDDWASDEEVKFPTTKGKDEIPPESTDHWSPQAVMSALNFRPRENMRSNPMPTDSTAQDIARTEGITRFLQGRVFFNHFVTLQTVVRPSTLIKAFNRGAAIMTKVNNPGVDFIIPVILPSADKNIFSRLGPLFGEWTEEQEKAADEIVSYIFVDGKARAAMTRTAAALALKNVVPTPDNFAFHRPKNYFMSVILSCGAPGDKMSDHTGVKIHRQSQGSGNFEKQIPVTALGIDPQTFQCLVSRPDVTNLLRDLRVGGRNPVRGLHNSPAQQARARLVRQVFLFDLHPQRQQEMAEYANFSRAQHLH